MTEGLGAALDLQSALGTSVNPALMRTMANPSRCFGHLVGYIEELTLFFFFLNLFHF